MNNSEKEKSLLPSHGAQFGIHFYGGYVSTWQLLICIFCFQRHKELTVKAKSQLCGLKTDSTAYRAPP